LAKHSVSTACFWFAATLGINAVAVVGLALVPAGFAVLIASGFFSSIFAVAGNKSEQSVSGQSLCETFYASWVWLAVLSLPIYVVSALITSFIAHSLSGQIDVQLFYQLNLIFICGVPAQIIAVVCSNTLHLVKRTRFELGTTLASLITFITANLLIFEVGVSLSEHQLLDMALALLGTRYVSALALMAYLVVDQKIGLPTDLRSLASPKLAAMALLGLPLALTWGSEGLFYVILNTFSASFEAAQLAIYQSALNLFTLCFVFFIGFSTSASIVTRYHEGAPVSVYSRINGVIALNAAIATTISIFISIFGDEIAEIYIKDANTAELMARAILFVAILMPFEMIILTIRAILRNFGDVIFPSLSVIVANFAFGIPCAYLFGVIYNWQSYGFLAASGATAILTLIILGARMHRFVQRLDQTFGATSRGHLVNE